MKYESITPEIKDDLSDELQVREIVEIISHYKRSVLFLIFLGLLIAGYIAYFKPSIYQANTLLKITSDRQGYYEDFLLTTSGGNRDIEDELVVLKSRPIAQKALEKLNIGIRYFTEEHLKPKELYKQAPFTVTYTFLSPQLYGRPFYLEKVDKRHFRLKLSDEKGEWQKIKGWFGAARKHNTITYDKVHTYGEKIETAWFSLQVNRIYPPQKDRYWFTIIPNEQMTGFVQGGILASQYVKQGSVVLLSFVDTVPERAAEIINRVVDAYIEKNLMLKSEGAKKQLYFIDMQLDAINKTLKGSSEKLQSYKATNIVVDLSNEAQLRVNKLSQLEGKRYEINMQIDIAENMLNHLKSQKSVTRFNIDYMPGSNSTIQSLLDQIQKAMSKYAVLSVNYTEKHPGVVKLKRELAFLKRSLIDALSANLETLRKQKERLLREIAQQEAHLKDVPRQEQQLEQLTRHFMVNEKIYSYLLEKRAETAILASSTISNTRVIEKAETPYTPVRPKRGLILLSGLLIGLILGIMQALLRHYFDNTLKKSEDIEKLSSATLYGTLPQIRSEKHLPVYTEAVRSLWVNLAFLGNDDSAKVISVTSTISGEGKSFTLYHLSRMIAQSSEHRIVVIDMDMRRATLHKKFGIENAQAGVSTLLAGHCTLEEAIRHTEYDNLDIITSGPKAPNQTKLIMSSAFESMLEKLSERYHYILIDTPPVGIVSDAMKIMHHSDMVLYLVKAEYSKREFLQNIDRLNLRENLNIGIVFNGIDHERAYYHYGYGEKYTENYYTYT
jgi:capsular exopolysaccharide synthesis family protein